MEKIREKAVTEKKETCKCLALLGNMELKAINTLEETTKNCVFLRKKINKKKVKKKSTITTKTSLLNMGNFLNNVLFSFNLCLQGLKNVLFVKTKFTSAVLYGIVNNVVSLSIWVALSVGSAN